MTMKHNNRLFKRALAIVMVMLPGLLQAQKAGDVISGIIEDNEGPMMMVNVTERDAADRIVAHSITDMEGNKVTVPKGVDHVACISQSATDLMIAFGLLFRIKSRETTSSLE